MKSLEEVIREAADKGWLSQTRIDRSGDKWQVSTPSRFTAGAWAVEIDADPVVALRAALEPYGIGITATMTVDEMLE